MATLASNKKKKAATHNKVFFHQLTSPQIKRIAGLIKEKEYLQRKIDRIDASLREISSDPSDEIGQGEVWQTLNCIDLMNASIGNIESDLDHTLQSMQRMAQSTSSPLKKA